MQKLLLPLALFLVSLSACAQSSSLDKFYDRFKSTGDEGSLSVSPGLLLNASFSGSGGDSNSWIRKITQIQLLILDAKKTPSVREQWSELSRDLQEDQFDELVSIRHGKDRVQLLSRDRKGGLKEVVFLTSDKEGSGIFIHFRGCFTAKDLETIQSSLQDK
jgi:hypothetical protein